MFICVFTVHWENPAFNGSCADLLLVHWAALLKSWIKNHSNFLIVSFVQHDSCWWEAGVCISLIVNNLETDTTCQSPELLFSYWSTQWDKVALFCTHPIN